MLNSKKLKNSIRKLFKQWALPAFAGLSLVAVKAEAAKTAAAAPAPTYTVSDTVDSGGGMKTAVGMQTWYGLGGPVMSGLHVMFQVKPQMTFGVGFGFDQNFDQLAAVADFRYTYLSDGTSGLFFEGDAGMHKAGATGFIGGVLMGFSHNLSSHLSVSTAAGLQMVFGGGSTKHVGWTQSALLGNFGIHWWF